MPQKAKIASGEHIALGAKCRISVKRCGRISRILSANQNEVQRPYFVHLST